MQPHRAGRDHDEARDCAENAEDQAGNRETLAAETSSIGFDVLTARGAVSGPMAPALATMIMAPAVVAPTPESSRPMPMGGA